MATAARLSIAADRVGACVRTFIFRGIDLTGVALAMQVRLRPDTPGAPLIDLATVTVANAQGLRMTGVETVAGVPTSTVILRINETTMKDAAKVPYFGEPGSASVLSYDLIGTFGGDKRRLVFGKFIALPTTYGADDAVPGSAAGISDGYETWTAATLTFTDDAVSVTIDGAELLAPLIEEVQGFRDGAQAAAADAADTLAAVDAAAAAALAQLASYPTTPQIADYVAKQVGVTNLFRSPINGVGILATGQPVGQENLASDFMPVLPGSKLCATQPTSRGGDTNYGWGFYDRTKTLINGLAGTAPFVPVTVPAGAYYARCSFQNSSNASTNFFDPYKAAVYATSGSNDLVTPTLKEITAILNARPKIGENLAVISRATVGGLQLVDGTVNNSGSSYRLLDYMSVFPGETLTCDFANGTGSSTFGWAFYDIDKNYVSGIAGSATGLTPVTVPANCYFARTSVEIVTNPTKSTATVWQGPKRPGRLGGKKWVNIGDSISANYAGRWQQYVMQKTGLTMPSQIAGGGSNMRGVFEQYVNSAHTPEGDPVNGLSTGGRLKPWSINYTVRGGNGTDDLGPFSNAPGPWTSGTTLTQDLADVDIVTVMLGTNDTYLYTNIGTPTDAKGVNTTYCAQIKWVIEGILIAKPGVRLIFIGPSNNAQGAQILAISEAQKTVCRFYNIPFIDMYYDSGINDLTRATYMDGDGVHYLELGQTNVLGGMVTGAFERFVAIVGP